MNIARHLRRATRTLPLVLSVALLAPLVTVSAAAEPAKVTTSEWRIHKPSTAFRDLPKLLPKEQTGFDAGIGQLEFVCLKSTFYLLLVQPSVKLRDSEPGGISVPATSPAAPGPLTFRNLYKEKSPLSRSLDLDADIHYAEISPALLASIAEASDLKLTLADRTYAITLSDLGPRLGSFRRFCEKGVVENPAHFDRP